LTSYALIIGVMKIDYLKNNFVVSLSITGGLIVVLFFSIVVLLYKSIKNPLDDVITYLEKSSNSSLLEELQSGQGVAEYNMLIETINKINFSLKANIDDRVKKAIELQHAHEELKIAYDELQELDKVKADFLANVSHELITPLISVEGYVEYIEEGKFGKINQKIKKGLDTSIINIKRLKNLLNQLLFYTRIDAGQEVLELKATDLREITSQVVEEHKENAKKKGLKIDLKSPKDLPKGVTDSEKFRQVLHNLVNNAIKFTEKGSVDVILSRYQDKIRVEIKDSGIGIAEEQKKKLFDKFSQLDASAKRKYGGVGLGLTVVNAILGLQEINLNLESVLGKGSVFWFLIPTR
ncbi:hypothetical protein GOV05_03160, partial [Candidatus Woesearchaeota archaeon]|nr:hypothetical protein [Candidatus Woesearchaeota archaeon]